MIQLLVGRMSLSRRLLLVAISFVAIALLPSSVCAQDLNRKDGNVIIQDFRFQSDEVLPELRIHYVTLGTPTRNAAGRVTNAVLLLHGTTASSAAFVAPTYASALFAKGQPLDATKYYLIIPDAIGHGGSSKPSNGMRAQFPHYTYSDMVDAQYRFVTEGLHIDRLKLVIGFSMGGMHTWLWGEKYPDLMDALMPMTSQPVQIAGHNLLWRRVIIDGIRNDPEWNGGNYEKQPSRWVSVMPLFGMMLQTPVRLQAAGPTRDKANDLFNTMADNWRKNGDANDVLYAFESSRDYDPEPALAKIKAKLLALNFADDYINSLAIYVMDPAVSKIPSGRSIIMPAPKDSFGHLNQLHPEIWRQYVTELLRSLPE